MIIPDRKKAVSVILSKSMGQHADGDEKPMGDHDDDSMLESISEDLMHAMSAGSAKDVAKALKAAFSHMEMQPHEEYGEEEE